MVTNPIKIRVLFVMICLFAIAQCGSPESEIKIQRVTLEYEHILIQCAADCNQEQSAIQSLGGQVNIRYRNIAALAAGVPKNQVNTLATALGRHNLSKDITVHITPKPTRIRVQKPEKKIGPALRSENSRDSDKTPPANSNIFSFPFTGVDQLHEKGQVGENVIVAVIDTGTANHPDITALSGSVIGGESFVPDDPESATSTLNDDHGTWVASLIAGHGMLEYPNDDPLIQAMSKYAPAQVVPSGDTTSMIPLIGTAPGAKIYAMKTFAADGHGASRSVVIQAMDRALTLKKKYNESGLNGAMPEPVSGDGSEQNPYVYDKLDIKVVNMSLGGVTLFAGFDIEDKLSNQMLKAGMLVVVAAGNEGPAAMTVGNPATGYGAIAVGAVNSPIHERILRELQLGPDMGTVFRPNSDIQIADFSSRGPNADGKRGPDIVANGVATLVQGTDGHISFISGTSLSAPTVSGAMATLAGAYPDRDAVQIREAVFRGANPNIVTHKASIIDQGFGHLDAAAAATLLDQGIKTRFIIPKTPDEIVPVLGNIADYKPRLVEGSTELNVMLTPGEASHFFIPTKGNETIALDVVNITAQSEVQNELFFDDLIVTVLDAPTAINNILFDAFVLDDLNTTFENPQPGLVRVAIVGDWTNVGAVSADVRIRVNGNKPVQVDEVMEGKLTDNVTHDAALIIPEGTAQVNFHLSWEGSWAYFPSHDLDLILVDPEGNPNFDGATLDSPEKVFIENPLPGTWTVLIDGYEVHGFRDEYELRVYDGAGQPMRIIKLQ